MSTLSMSTCATEAGRHMAAAEVETVQVDEAVNRVFYLLHTTGNQPTNPLHCWRFH